MDLWKFNKTMNYEQLYVPVLLQATVTRSLRHKPSGVFSTQE
jgi:hypothetical protein